MGEYVREKNKVVLSGNCNSLVLSLDSQRQDGIFCDVLLKINDHTLPAHSCVLSACSSYLQDFFAKDRPRTFSEGVPQVIEFPLVPESENDEATAVFNSLIQLIGFFYGRQLEVDEQNYTSLSALAGLLQVEEVVQQCEEFKSHSGKGNDDKECEETEDVSIDNGENNIIPDETICAKPMQDVLGKDPTEPETILDIHNYVQDITVSSLDKKRKRGIDEENENEVLETERRRNTPRVKQILHHRATPKVKFGMKKKLNVSRRKVKGRGMGWSRNKGYDAIEKTGEEVKDDGERLNCKNCEYSTTSEKAMKKHRLSHFGRPYSCRTCDVKAKKPADMLKHLMEECNLEHKKETICSLCDEDHQSNEQLQEHLKLHDHKKPFLCTACDMRCPSKTSLMLHHSKHSQQRPHECNMCGRTFKTKYSLQNHLIVHDVQKQYLCDQCGYSTSYKASLEAHKLIHTGNTLKCPHPGCTFQAVRRSNLNEHLLTHNKEKAYQCEICGQSFSRSKNLRRHAYMHGKGSQVIHCCSVCNFISNRRDKVKAHVKKHHPLEDISSTILPDKFQKRLHALLEMASTDNVNDPETTPPPQGQVKVEHHLYLTDNDNFTLTPISVSGTVTTPAVATTAASSEEQSLPTETIPISIQNIDEENFNNFQVTEVIIPAVYTFNSMSVAD